MPLPRCFFDVSINGVPSGRIVFELFKDECPRTAENFRCLCTGEKGEGPTTFKPLHYKGTPIHRIVKGFIIQGGDFSNGDGTGGESIYGGMFKDENFKQKHDRPFLLSMANKGPNTNGSQFFITTRPAPHLDDIHVVFGRVVGGVEFVTEVENQKIDANHRPYADVRITHSGELVLLKKKKPKEPATSVAPVVSSASSSSAESSSDSDSESETDSEEERERRRKRKQKRKKREALKKSKRKERDKGGGEEEKEKKKRKKVDKVDEEEDEKRKRRKKKRKERLERKEKKKQSKKLKVSDGDDGDSKSEGSASETEPVTSTVPELMEMEVPEDIKANRNSWLHRRSRTPSPKEDSGPVQIGARLWQGKRRVSGAGVGNAPPPSSPPPPPPRKPQSYKPMLVDRGENEMSNSGRVLKGRGAMMYRTPPREGETDDLRSNLQQGHTQKKWGGRMMMDREEYSSRRDNPRRSPPPRGPPPRVPPPRGPLNQRSDDNVPWFRRKTWRDRSPLRDERASRERELPSSGRDQRREDRRDDRRDDRGGGDTVGRWDKNRGRPESEEEEVVRGHRNSRDKAKKSHRHHRHSDRDPSEDGEESEQKPKHHHRHHRRHSRSSSRSSDGRDRRGRGQEHDRRHHHHHNKEQRRRTGDNDRRTEPAMTSKWARHQDSDGSSSDEDRQIEKAFQQKHRKDIIESVEEDVFGINKFLPVP